MACLLITLACWLCGWLCRMWAPRPWKSQNHVGRLLFEPWFGEPVLEELDKWTLKSFLTQASHSFSVNHFKCSFLDFRVFYTSIDSLPRYKPQVGFIVIKWVVRNREWLAMEGIRAYEVSRGCITWITRCIFRLNNKLLPMSSSFQGRLSQEELWCTLRKSQHREAHVPVFVVILFTQVT